MILLLLIELRKNVVELRKNVLVLFRCTKYSPDDLYGQQFILFADHKPFLTTSGSKKAMSTNCSAGFLFCFQKILKLNI